MKENGELETLETKWFKERNQCDNKGDKSAYEVKVKLIYLK